MSTIRDDSPQGVKSSGRKRTRTGSDSNGEENKKRGRPRLETQDESAADRRRTQIRVAQRAYRQRKETTIDDLRKQVQDLQGTVQSMKQTFTEFSKRCLTSNVPSAVLDDLQNIVQQYSNTQGLDTTPSLSESPTLCNRVSDNTPNTASKKYTPNDTGNAQNLLQQSSTNQPNWSSPAGPSDVPPAIIYPSQLTEETSPGVTTIPVAARSNPVNLSLLRSLEIPESYSFCERTLARRLHRASCEFAYRLACDPSRLPDLFNSVFKLTSKAASIDQIKYILESTLRRGPKEPLSNWGVTYIHVGGAGTHYARPLEEGGLVFQPQSSWSVTSIGPHRLVGQTLGETMTAEMLLCGTAGMEGEWFDAYDVEGYLKEKGIDIDPSSSFAEIELSEDNPPTNEDMTVPTAMGSMVYYMNTMPAAASGPNAMFSGFNPDYLNYMPPEHMHRKSYPAMPQQMQPRSGDRRATAPSIGQFHLGVPPFSFQQPRKQRFTIEVAEFIKQLSLAGSCLMRAPGYRRKDIDIALRKAAVRSQ